MIERSRSFSARKTDLVVEGVGSELLIFDRHTDTGHCLGEAAALVWRSCESGATLTELAAMLFAHNLASSLDDATTLAEAALSELDEKGLLETSLRPAGIKRRQALGRIAGVGALAFSAPLIVSATASAAQVNLGDLCGASKTCPGGSTCKACSGTLCPSGGMCCSHNGNGGTLPNGSSCSANGNCCSGSCVSSKCVT
jgi:hypothetical protein